MPMLSMRPVAITEPGRRENNEDAFFASARLVAVADGVGGAAAGELASRLAVMKMSGLETRRLTGTLECELAAAVADANDAIGFSVVCRPETAGLATTLTAVALSNDGTYFVANVGDSRTYVLRDRRLRRLTRDDSLVQQLIDDGVLREDEARRHPRRNIVLRALDGADCAVETPKAVPALIGDRLLLCSDGVTDYLDDSEIQTLLRQPDARDAAKSLIDAALTALSSDNITVVVADVVSRNELADGWLDARPASGPTAN